MDIELLYERECSICLDDKEKEWWMLDCQHEYHTKCIQQWMQVRMTCPICIRAIPPPIETTIQIERVQIENRDESTLWQRRMANIVCYLIILSILFMVIGIILMIQH